jgi:hypothetical protein
MIIDKFLQVSNAQAVTTSAASTDVIDAGATKNASIGRDLGSDADLYMVFTVGEAVTASGAATVTFALQDSADNSSFADVIVSAAIGKATLVAGAQVVLALPPGMRRYIRANYTVATGPLTAGKFSAQVVPGYEFRKSYPDIL